MEYFVGAQKQDTPVTERTHYSAVWEREMALEQEADALLRTLPRDPECPVYTEKQMAQNFRRWCVFSLDAHPDTLPFCAPTQAAIEELTFLMTVTPLDARERCVLHGWMLGWSQAETQEQKQEFLGVFTQQSVSYILRKALEKCYDAVGLTFAQFSRHTLYRRPLRRRETWRMVVCPHCQERFVRGWGSGRYCSSACHESASHRDRI